MSSCPREVNTLPMVTLTAGSEMPAVMVSGGVSFASVAAVAGAVAGAAPGVAPGDAAVAEPGASARWRFG